MTMTIKSPSEAAGVICPKETGKMPTDADCRGCPHFGACWNALMEALEEPGETLIIGGKYVSDPPFGGKRKIVRIVGKADEGRRLNIEAAFPHHANGMDWYEPEDGQYSREECLTRLGEKDG